MDFVDRTLPCLDCEGSFVFTAGEQSFYQRRGFRETPKRCKSCRDSRKARRGPRDDANGDQAESSAHDHGHGHGNRAPRATRELFDATCASCGAPASVPFRPASGRPVYCRDCYAARQGQGSSYGIEP